MIDKLAPILHLKRLTGSERLHRSGAVVGPDVLTFWQWSASNLVSNTSRGCFAEFLVAADLGILDGTRNDWGRCDLIAADGLRIDVEASGYLQTWLQKRLSMPRFSIRRALDPTTEAYTPAPVRNSDVYVFSLHHHRNKATVDPLDVSQWTFYILPTAVVNACFRGRSSVSLSDVESAYPSQTEFGGIAAAIRAALTFSLDNFGVNLS